MEGNSLLLLDYFLTNRHNLSIFCGYTLNKMGFCRTQSPFVSLDKPLLQGFMDTLSQILYFFVIWLAKKTHKLYDLVIYQVFTNCDTVFHENVFFSMSPLHPMLRFSIIQHIFYFRACPTSITYIISLMECKGTF